MENKIKAILDSNMHFAGLELISFNQSKAIADIIDFIKELQEKNVDPNNTYEHPHNMQHD